MRKYKPNTEKYFLLVSNLMSSINKATEYTEEYDEIVKNIIFNREGPRKLEIDHPPKTLFIANKLFRPMSEIFSTMETIENISVYMRTFPYKRYGVSKLSYLKYHIESSLNEIYILKIRLETYLRVIEKVYKALPNYTKRQGLIKNTRKFINKSLDNIVRTRGWHVHRYRYTASDLDHLLTLELFSKYNDEDDDDKPFWCKSVFFKQSFKAVRKKRIKEIKELIEALWDMLETYFKTMLVLVSKNDKILYPPDIS